MPRDSVEVGLYSSEDGVELLWWNPWMVQSKERRCHPVAFVTFGDSL